MDPLIKFFIKNNKKMELCNACKNNDINKVRNLLKDKYSSIDVDRSDYHGNNSLYIACYHNYIGIAKLLLERPDIDINKPNTNKEQTPFFAACFHNGIEIVKLLLKRPEIDINQSNKFNITPFYCACYHDHIELVKILLERSDIDINKTNNSLETPLYNACNQNRIEMVKLLLERHDIDINKQNHYGNTPLHRAWFNNNMEIVKLLLNHPKINPFIKNNEGEFYFTQKDPAKEMIKLQQITELFIIIHLSKSSEVKGFFKINKKLPIEVNMRIANLVYDSSKIIIKEKIIEDVYHGYLKKELK